MSAAVEDSNRKDTKMRCLKVHACARHTPLRLQLVRLLNRRLTCLVASSRPPSSGPAATRGPSGRAMASTAAFRQRRRLCLAADRLAPCAASSVSTSCDQGRQRVVGSEFQAAMAFYSACNRSQLQLPT